MNAEKQKPGGAGVTKEKVDEELEEETVEWWCFFVLPARKHARTRTHARTHARTHTHTHTDTDPLRLLFRVCVCVCCLLYTSPSPRDQLSSRMPSSA